MKDVFSILFKLFIYCLSIYLFTSDIGCYLSLLFPMTPFTYSFYFLGFFLFLFFKYFFFLTCKHVCYIYYSSSFSFYVNWVFVLFYVCFSGFVYLSSASVIYYDFGWSFLCLTEILYAIFLICISLKKGYFMKIMC